MAFIYGINENAGQKFQQAIFMEICISPPERALCTIANSRRPSTWATIKLRPFLPTGL